ncbi:MAG: hypothetical protein WCI05_11170 [Myxococcales bacterium]
MRLLNSILALCLVSQLGCSSSGGGQADLVIAPDVVKRAAKLAPMDLSQSPLQSGLADWERAVVDKLVQAASHMDTVFWQQVDPEGMQIFNSFAGATSDQGKAVRLMMDANYGRWDRFQEFAPFVGTQLHPKGAYVFPTDLTQQELDAYIAAHPEEKAALLSPFTVVRRSAGRLVTVPYHEAYASYVLPTASLLEEAAALSQNVSLATYLRLQANALRTDDYFQADLAWLDLNGNVDLSIGPQETQDDLLSGQKAFYKANILLVDQVAANQLAKYKAEVPALQENLPVDPKYKPSQTGTMTPMIVADDIRRAGQVRSIMEAVAFSLPNDRRVWEAKGAKKVMMGNFLSARRTTVLEPLAGVVLDDAVASQMNGEAHFTWVLMHEISHTLGPREVTKDGKQIPVTEALGTYYSPIEEGKADIGGLYDLPYLIGKGVVTGSLASHYVSYLAEALRSIRFGLGSPYGVIRLASWNVFVEKGVLRADGTNGRFVFDVDSMTVAVRELLVTLITIEGEGDQASASAFIASHTTVTAELKSLLDAAETTVPFEFVPVYKQ